MGDNDNLITWFMKSLLIVGLVSIFIGTYSVPSFSAVEPNGTSSMFGGQILYVGGVGPGNYTSIQDAIENASDGDIIFVYAQIYVEHLFINTSVTLLGEHQELTIVDGQNYSSVIGITCNSVCLQNISVRNSGGYADDAGISVDADSVAILNCTIYRCRTGVLVQHSSNICVEDCCIHTTGEGVYVLNSQDISVTGCQVCHSAIGLRFNDSNGCALQDSYFHTNGFGCYFDSSSNISVNHCALDDNNDNQGGAYVTGCSLIVFNDSNICHNGVGVICYDSEDVQISFCTINLNTKRALRFSDGTTNVFLWANEIGDNFHYGIHTSSPLVVSNTCFYNNSLHSLYATTFCDARYNWWNSFFGPSFTLLGRSERVGPMIPLLTWFPWLLNPPVDVGASWDTMSVFTPVQVPLHSSINELPGVDSDGDGVPDWWELKWGYDPLMWDDHFVLDEDDDGLCNVEECYTDVWGSNPFKQDIFVEIDWMQSRYPGTNQPDQVLIDQAILLFEQHNISLHVDIGLMGGGELIQNWVSPSFVDFRDMYWSYFLHHDVNHPRKGVFHYGVIADDGMAGYAIFGWDHLDCFTIGAQQLYESFPLYEKKHLIMYGMLHELGHGLGLFGDTHGGIDNRESIKLTSLETWKYIRYRSCMNYRFTFSIYGYSDGSHGCGDFDDWGHLILRFFKDTCFFV